MHCFLLTSVEKYGCKLNSVISFNETCSIFNIANFAFTSHKRYISFCKKSVYFTRPSKNEDHVNTPRPLRHSLKEKKCI